MADMLSAVAIIFILAGPFLLVANRYDLPAAPLLIFAGILAGLFIEEVIVLELAQFGIALLVFTFGIGIQLSEFEIILEDSELAAFAQILVVGSLGVGFGLVLGIPLEETIYLGIAAALSSTIVATALLETEIRTQLVQGRLSQSIQFVQDLVAVAFILVLGAEVFELDPIVLQIGYGVLFIVAALVVNRYLFGVMGTLAGDSDELMIIGVISMLVVFMGAAEAVDVSIVVGAFAAGIAVRYDPAEYLGLLNGVESVEDFFVAIFFVAVGGLIALPVVDVTWLAFAEKLVIVAGLVVLTVVVKPALTIAILIYRGYEARTSTLTALSTDQVSEFALIIAIQALILEQLTQDVFDAIILAAAITMIISTFTQRYNETIYRTLRTHGIVSGRHSKIDELSDVPDDLTDHVVVLGYGRKGGSVVDTLEGLDTPYVVVENDPARREVVRAECEAYVFGDAMEPYTWEKSNVDEARAIVSTVPSETVSRRLLDAGFDASLVLRATDEGAALELLEDGATYVVVPDVLAGEQLTDRIRALFAGELTPEELRSSGLSDLEVDRSTRTDW